MRGMEIVLGIILVYAIMATFAFFLLFADYGNLMEDFDEYKEKHERNKS